MPKNESKGKDHDGDGDIDSDDYLLLEIKLLRNLWLELMKYVKFLINLRRCDRLQEKEGGMSDKGKKWI